MTSPLVSVLIPCYNKARFVGEAIRSALEQTYPHVEVIAVDDGSTDGTAEVIRSFADRVVFLQQRNGGTAAARQLGLEHARGEIVGLLDHDDRWLPHKLERQLPLFDDPGVALVTAPYYVMDETGKRLRQCEWPGAEALEIHRLLVQNPIGSICTMFRRDAALAAGGFDPAIRGCDDWDLWIRIAARHGVAVVDEPLAEYRSYPDQLSRNGLLMYRNRKRVLAKYRRLHQSCDACEAAYRAGRALADERLHAFAAHMVEAGFVAYDRGDYRQAWRYYIAAVRARPAFLGDRHLLRILASLAKRSLVGTLNAPKATR